MPVERNIRDILESGGSTLLEADMSRRLDMLVRQGMLPVAKLPLLKRGLEKMKSGKVGTPQERDAVSNVLDQMMYIILGDDTVFQRARQHTQKNRYQTEESEINSAEESDDDNLNEWEELLLDIQTLEEKNVPTNPKLWSKYKSQAKSKFDVYPSAYANGWAAKMYKKAGGSWKTVSEDVEMSEAYKTPEEAKAFESGKKAARSGQKYNDNPHKEDALKLAWSKGHNKVREEVEQVDELKKSTLSSYIQKAADPTKKKSNVNLASKAAHKLATSDDMNAGEKEDRKAFVRSKGIQTAAKKLAKEESELEEGLPPHLKKILDKKGNIDPKKVSKEVHGGKKSDAKVTDVTPKGYGPKEEVELDEKIEDMEMGDVIKDFQKSDAPQFKGKSKEKRREMAIAAKLSKEENEEETTVYMNNPFAAAKKSKLEEYKTKNPGSEVEDSRQRAKRAAERLSRKVAKTEKETDPGIKEESELEEYITSKQVKMAKGIANDPRHKGGDMTGAAKKMEKIKKGLSNHPAAQKALRLANEDFADYTDEEFDALIEMSYKEKFQAMLKKKGKSLADMSDDEKKGFFNSVDAAHKAKNENFMSDIKKQLNSKMNDKASEILAKRKKDNEKAVKDMKTMAPHMKNPALGEEQDPLLADELPVTENGQDAYENYTMKSDYAKSSGAMSKDKTNIDTSDAKSKLMKKKGVTEGAASDAKRDYDADDKRGLAPTKSDAPKKVSDASNAKEIEHIVPQLRKTITVGKEVQFQDGKTHKISKGHAAKFLNKYMNSKPADKQKMQSSAHKSHDHFMKHV